MEWKWVHLFSGLSKNSFNLLVRVQLTVMALAGLILFSFWANAERCQVSKPSVLGVGAEHVVVTAAGNEITLISTYESKPEQRKIVDDILLPENGASLEEILTNLSEVFKKDKTTIQASDSFAFVQEALISNAVAYVLVYQSKSTFDHLWLNATQLNAVLGFYAFHREKTQTEALRRYMQDSVGITALLHADQPYLFKGIEYANLETNHPLVKASDAPSPADARLQEILSVFHDSAARRNLKKLAKLLKNGGYGKDSDASIKKDILERFPKRARELVGSWVNFALDEKSKVTQIENSHKFQIVETLLAKQGKGLVLIPNDQFKYVFAAFKEGCAH